jgi:hypothetical protein
LISSYSFRCALLRGGRFASRSKRTARSTDSI